MDGKFLTDETKDVIVDVLDASTSIGILEPLERPAYRIVLNQVDKYADKWVPDALDSRINQTAQLALIGEYEDAAGVAGSIIDELIDFENVNDEIEKLVFVDGMKFIVRQLQLYIKSKQAEKEAS